MTDGFEGSELSHGIPIDGAVAGVRNATLSLARLTWQFVLALGRRIVSPFR